MFNLFSSTARQQDFAAIQDCHAMHMEKDFLSIYLPGNLLESGPCIYLSVRNIFKSKLNDNQGLLGGILSY